MQDDKEQRDHEHIWKAQEVEPMRMSTEELCARARKQERENVFAHWILRGLTPMLAAVVAYEMVRLYQAHRFLLVATITWLLLTFGWTMWKPLRSGPRRIGKMEPCIQFLARELESKRQFSRAIREWILLLVPAVVGAWWAGGPALRAREMGINWPWLLQRHEPLALIVPLLVLAFIWFAMTNIARRTSREIDKLGR